MDQQRFVIRMDPDAFVEYRDLDNSIVLEVDKALESLEIRADEVGKVLGNKREIVLAGTKEKKLRRSGIRIIYTITDQYVDIMRIVVVLLVGYKKDESTVYKSAADRYAWYKEDSDHLQDAIDWSIDRVATEDIPSDEEDIMFPLFITLSEDGIWEAKVKVIEGVTGKGFTEYEAAMSLAESLLNYAKEYMEDFYHHFSEKMSEMRYIVKILDQAGDEEEIGLIMKLFG